MLVGKTSFGEKKIWVISQKKAPFCFFSKNCPCLCFFPNNAPCLNAKNTSNQPQWYFSSQSWRHSMDRPSGLTGLHSRMVQSIWSAEQFSYPNGDKKNSLLQFLVTTIKTLQSLFENTINNLNQIIYKPKNLVL